MSLPPLPNPAHHIVIEGICIGYTSEAQTKAYGQECREAALEEAAQICRLLADCEENTTGYRNGAAWCAEKIRSLK